MLLCCAQSYLCHLMDCSLPGSSVHGTFQARDWSGLPFPTPGDLPDPGMEPCLLHWQVDSLLLSHQGSPKGRVAGGKCRRGNSIRPQSSSWDKDLCVHSFSEWWHKEQVWGSEDNGKGKRDKAQRRCFITIAAVDKGSLHLPGSLKRAWTVSQNRLLFPSCLDPSGWVLPLGC